MGGCRYVCECVEYVSVCVSVSVLSVCVCVCVCVYVCVCVTAGYGFVDFESPMDATKAVQSLQSIGVLAQFAKVPQVLLNVR